MKIAVFWFRRDLRLNDNTALNHALKSGLQVLPIFIFDQNIIEELPRDDARVNFIHHLLAGIHQNLNDLESSIRILQGDPLQSWNTLISEYDIAEVYYNRDYEPYAIERDEKVGCLLAETGITVHSYKDQVIFEKNEVVKDNGKPYTVFTPYKRKWLRQFNIPIAGQAGNADLGKLHKSNYPFPSLSQLGFKKSEITVKDYNLSFLNEYAAARDFPAKDKTSYLSPHLRFGAISVRQVIGQLSLANEAFLSELIWREFFMQILFHFPKVVHSNFNSKYDGVKWKNDEKDFDKWCEGKTGYPLVDAGMRQLNTTGYMHNRVRMVTAGFLCKHLLIDWKWGEAYFARKLLDYELAANNGNWQWTAGTGCDAAPYFRVFNPTAQMERFDKHKEYVKKWVHDWESPSYPQPMVEHKFARNRAIETYKNGIQANSL